MENLRKAIDAIGNKESVLFKEAISDELVRRLRESLLKNQAEIANHILVSEVNVGAPSAPPSTSPSKKMVAPQSPATGVEMDSEEMHALAEPRKKRKKKMNEAPEIDPYMDPGETKKEPFGPKSFVGHIRMGTIHPNYEMWRHTQEKTDHKGNKHHIHEFSIVHKKTRERVGEIFARGGKINKKTGEHTDGTGKDLRITYVGIHGDHSARKVGTSLAVAAYKYLHKIGHSIKSDTRQSIGGARVWDTLRKDKDVKRHVQFHHGYNKPVTAHKVPHDKIWDEHPHGQERILVLHAKKKKKPALVSEDIEMANIPMKPKSGGLGPRNFEKMVAPQSPTTGLETAMEGDEELMKELQAAFGLGAKADAEKPVAKDDDISLDPNFEKEYLSKSLSLDGHKIQLKQIGLGLSKPVRVYVDGQRWELFPGPESAMKALKPYLKELDAEKLKKNEGA